MSNSIEVYNMKSKFQSLFAGIGSIFCLGPVNTAIPIVHILPFSHQTEFEEVDGYQRDWEMVGNDLWQAFDRFERENIHGKKTK